MGVLNHPNKGRKLKHDCPEQVPSRCPSAAISCFSVNIDYGPTARDDWSIYGEITGLASHRHMAALGSKTNVTSINQYGDLTTMDACAFMQWAVVCWLTPHRHIDAVFNRSSVNVFDTHHITFAHAQLKRS
jgi:hypothetical protein